LSKLKGSGKGKDIYVPRKENIGAKVGV